MGFAGISLSFGGTFMPYFGALTTHSQAVEPAAIVFVPLANYFRPFLTGRSEMETMWRASAVVTESSFPITANTLLPMEMKSGWGTGMRLPLENSSTKGLNPLLSRSRIRSRFINVLLHKLADESRASVHAFDNGF